MRWIVLSAVLSALCMAPVFGAEAVVIPEVSQPGQGAVIRAELVFPLENRPTPQCHASTIVQTSSGLVAAWFAGTAEGKSDVGIWVSRYEGNAWTKPIEVADGVQSADVRHPCWNPVLFQPKSGPLMLFYKVGPSPSTWWGLLRTSDDGGKTWSAARRLGEDPKIGHLLGPVKNKPIELKDGTILCPSSSEHDGWRVHFEATRDLGKTWDVIGPIHDGKAFGAIQPSLLTYPDGRLQILCRSKQEKVTQAWSTDGGKTWDAMTATDLPNPNSGTDAVTLADGRQLIVYNHTTRLGLNQPAKGRSMLNVATSRDGKTWTPVLTLEKQKGEYSYPAVIQTADGLVHITYTYQRQGVKHVVLDASKLAQ